MTALNLDVRDVTKRFGDAPSVLRQARALSDACVIMLTARIRALLRRPRAATQGGRRHLAGRRP